MNTHTAAVRPCEVRPAAWWDLGNPGNAKAIALCGTCPFKATCAPVIGKPQNQIIGGVPYSDRGQPLAICDTCRQPITNGTRRGADTNKRCDTCRDEAVAVHHAQIVELRRRRKSYAAIAREIGLSSGTIRHYVNRHPLEVAA